MIKKILLTLALLGLGTQLSAYETEVEKESSYYVVVKGIYILGDDVKHEDVILKGDGNYGFGIDLGYRLEHGFALEYDFSYATNDVKEDINTFNASYMTHALDLVYSYEIIHNTKLFAKAGYEYEKEKISDLNIDNSSDGAVLGAGVEYELDHTYNLVVEYEHSTIDGPRGDSINLGVMYNF
ncbi:MULTISPECIES: porin family protein [Sulfurimonas]|uniref:porin family protein n=1 Tax=Sulfurimonas TaxID=202746 RepID=UPI001264796A|nr:porin family protein [Sulfurimonas indica]